MYIIIPKESNSWIIYVKVIYVVKTRSVVGVHPRLDPTPSMVEEPYPLSYRQVTQI